MQSLIRSKSAGVTGGRGTAGAGPGRDLLYGTPTPNIRKGEALHLEDTTVHLAVTQATRHHHITLPSKLEGRLARLPQLPRGDLLSTQGLAYFMEAVLNAAIGYQALQLPHPQDALRHARQQLTKAWAHTEAGPRPSPGRP